ncbi:MAG: RNase adapter RapZ [Candidatus Limnocylindrales bacterium]
MADPELEATGTKPRPHVAIITGLSGAGKTATSKLFEDLGYHVVDNLPSELLGRLADLIVKDPERFPHIALVLDVRQGDAPLAFGAAIGALEGRDIDPQVFFLEARDEVLIRRYSETRHRHPLGHGRGVGQSIAAERRMLQEVREQADVIIDTSDLSARQLREWIERALRIDTAPEGISLQLISFGYKYGVPLESDLVFDVRFMENPFYLPALRDSNGLTEAVRDFVLGQPVTQRFLELMHDFFAFSIPAYRSEGKTRLTVAIGCTGGFHRSVSISEAMAGDWRTAGYGLVDVWHRELERGKEHR